MPDTVGINKYANCVELKPKWSTINIGLDKTYKKNPEKFAQFFYEQGKANATEDVMRKTKNINMSERRAPEVTSKGGTQFKSLSTDSGRGLKIKSIKRK